MKYIALILALVTAPHAAPVEDDSSAGGIIFRKTERMATIPDSIFTKEKMQFSFHTYTSESRADGWPVKIASLKNDSLWISTVPLVCKEWDRETAFVCALIQEVQKLKDTVRVLRGEK